MNVNNLSFSFIKESLIALFDDLLAHQTIMLTVQYLNFIYSTTIILTGKQAAHVVVADEYMAGLYELHLHISLV